MVVDVSPFSLVVADAELVDDVAYEVVGLITGPTNTNQWCFKVHGILSTVEK